MNESSRIAHEFRRAVLGVALLTTAAAAQGTTRVSVGASGAEANDASFCSSAVVSADGRLVAFVSDATNLVAGDSNGSMDAFVHDRSTGTTERVSVDSAGAQTFNSSSIDGIAISSDGRFVAFASNGSTLVANDMNAGFDIFVRDRVAGTTERVSIDSAGVEGDSDSFFPQLSADGRIVAFVSYATNLDPTDSNGTTDVYVHDRTTGLTTRVSKGIAGADARDHCNLDALSADGNVVAFESYADNLVIGDHNAANDIFVHERATAVTSRVNVDSAGAEAIGDSEGASLSTDGQVVAFASAAQNLVAGDTNGGSDVFIHDRSTGSTERVSVDTSGAQADADSTAPSISADGQVVAFRSDATDLVAGDTNGTRDIFVHHRSIGSTVRASVDSAGAQGNGRCYTASLAGDGRAVAFYGGATNLVAGDTNATFDVFVHELCIDATWSNYGAGFPGTNGIPTLVAQADPLLGTTLAIDLGSSSNTTTLAWLLVGTASTQVPMTKGGDLLVVIDFALVLTLPSGGTTIVADVADDHALCGVEFFAQALELDAGAAKGVSSTPGLRLLLGR